MIIHDEKKALMTIMRRRGKKGEVLAGPAPMKTESVKDEDGEVDGRHAAAEDAIAAFHEKSPEKLMQALANFHDLHAMRKSEEDKAPSDEHEE